MGEYKYGRDHRRLRDEIDQQVQAGFAWCCAAVCLKHTRWIPPGTPWDLGHTPSGDGYVGPCHAACNRGDGGRRSWGRGVAAERTGRRSRKPRPQPDRWRPTTNWLGRHT